jgi:hypothetical protein
MAHPDQSPHAVPFTGIAEPHQSAVSAILRAALAGAFSAEEAELLIERIRARDTASPSSIEDRTGLRSDTADPVLNDPDRTLT